MARSRTLPEKAYYKELKPISDAYKEYSDVHEKDTEILQYDSDKASVKNEENDNEKSLNVNPFLIGQSSRFGRGVKFNRRYLY